MALLSEVSIREKMGRGELVVGGDDSQAVGAAYQFRPYIVVPGGGRKRIHLVIPGTAPPALLGSAAVEHGYVVEPRSLVWVRMLETVKLPQDVCAVWWQTNRLSRKGLMLVNMSLVEPGYEGPLACLFVNFGDRPIRISPAQTVARLVFHQLDKPAVSEPGAIETLKYDDDLAEVAVGGSSSFLSLNDYRVEFQEARREAEQELIRGREAALATLQKTIEEKTAEAVEKIKDPRNAWRSFAVAAFGFALLLAVLKFVPWIEGLWPQRFEGVVDASVASALQQADLVERIIQLETELERLRDAEQGQ